MVDLCPVVKGPSIEWWSEKSLFMVQNVRYSNGPPSHLTLPFEYQTCILSGESGIQVFGIQMVTVRDLSDHPKNRPSVLIWDVLDIFWS